MHKDLKVRLIAVLAVIAGLVGRAYGASINQDYLKAKDRLAVFDKSLTLQERKLIKLGPEQGRLTGSLLKKYEARQELKEDAGNLQLMIDLRKQLLLLPGESSSQKELEAEVVARIVVPAFGDLRREYAMVRPALFHNLLVNMGLKEQGLCWQWARDLTNRLNTLNLKTFDVLWATARGGTLREHNTVVLVSHGHPLEEGLLLDGWKYSGKPFWIRVVDDKKHPWKLGEYYGGR